jgi:glycosyltransferase involved in cell wall biosynthesis
MPPTDPEASDRPGISVVTTVRDEAGTIGELLRSLIDGTRRPDEIVVADGGSTDSTPAIVETAAGTNPPVVLLRDVGDRASGRNAAVRAATFERIAVIDGGCLPRPDWLERIEEAFETGAEWVGGFYEPVGKTDLSTAIGLTMVYVREEAERHFVPSARSLGFTRRLWKEVGGFPEGMQFAEDTSFAEELFERGHTPRFAPEAIVEWHPPETLAAQSRTMFNWGHGDGTQGLRTRHYARVLLAIAGFGALVLVLALIDLRLMPLALVPVVAYVARATRHKYRHMDGAIKWLLIPLAALNGTLSSLVGFLKGRLDRSGR